MKKFYAVVLLYNTNINDSITCQCIEKYGDNDIEIIILDNSTVENDNNKIAREKEYTYISMNGNKGLSFPYNQAIKYIFDNNEKIDNKYIIWLDDDTELTRDYFIMLTEAISQNPNVDIFAPIVYGQDGIIYSPNNAGYLKNKLIANESEADTLIKFNAINSCLCVKVNVYNDYRYDENLFLDQADQNFFDDMRLLNKKFYTLHVTINQNFSQRNNNLNPRKMLIRYKIRCKDIMIYGRKSFIRSILSLIKALGVTLQIGIKCRSIKIIFVCSFISVKMFFTNLKNIILKKIKGEINDR